jgi:hypothetical protein
MNAIRLTVAATLSLAGLVAAVGARAAAQEASAGSAVPCAVPLVWRIARVDAEFGLDAREVADVVSDAAALWESGAGRPLFRHDPEGGFPIRVVFDERQGELGERLRRQRELEALGRELQAEREVVLARRDRLEAEMALHQERASDVERRIAEHNAAVRTINAGRGASEERRAELEATGEALRREQEALMAERPALEADEASLRETESALNARIRGHRTLAEELAASFPPVAVEAGEYRERVEVRDGRPESVSREIRLYRFQGEADLIAVAAHELGHALGLGHTDDPGGVMSAESRGDAPPDRIAASDLALLEAACPQLGRTRR